MFVVDSSITDLKVRGRGIFKLLYSMNTHPVATPEMSTEEAKCYILFFQEGQNLSAFIGMFLPNTNKRYYYRYTSNPFPFEGAADVEDESRRFAEDMGFLIDEVKIAAMSPTERNQWFDEQALFTLKKEPEPQKAPEPKPEAAPEPKPAAAEPAAAAAAKPKAQSAPPKPAARKPAPAPQKSEEPEQGPQQAAPAQQRPDDILRQAIKAGVVRPPKKDLNRDLRGVTGVVDKDMEALARLFASF